MTQPTSPSFPYGADGPNVIQLRSGNPAGDQPSAAKVASARRLLSDADIHELDRALGASLEPVYILSRFGNRTICDLPDEHFPEPAWRLERDRRIQNGVLSAIVLLVLGFVAASLWTAAYQLGERQNAAISVTGFEGGSK